MTVVAVVGGGVAGAATAWQLARRGAEVVTFEQFGPGHRRGSSHGGSRIFRFAYADAWYVRLAQRAADLWREAETAAGEELLDVTGGIDFGDLAGLELLARTFTGCGIDFEWLDATAARQRWPGFAFDGPVVHQPGAGRIRADAAVAALHRLATAAGGAVRWETRVDSIQVTGGRPVLTTGAGEVLSPDVVVVTAGAWVGDVAAGLVPLPPLRVTQEQVFHFTPRESAPWPSFIHHRAPYVYGLETPGEGVKVAEHHTGTTVHPDQRSFEVDPAGRQRVVAHVERWMPGLDPAPHHEVTCLYTTTPDESFVLERRGPVVVGSPCSGHGFKFAPAVGAILADLALDGEAE